MEHDGFLFLQLASRPFVCIEEIDRNSSAFGGQAFRRSISFFCLQRIGIQGCSHADNNKRKMQKMTNCSCAVEKCLRKKDKIC